MAIQPGTKLGHYEVLAVIGQGGMGEVHRAHDTKLARDVAIKFLPPHFARDSERVARFRREATLLASLNHSNIAQIYGVEDSGETHYLVMELVPGMTLAERILSGPVEIEEALRICSQIAEALEHAHERNIIHRDLKPANVKLTPEGKVKVLDFGLAKAFAGDASEGARPDSNSPTMSAAATTKGVILGTAAYMSPEQAKGKTVDRRADIWALGCILFELLTRRAAFSGDGVTEILASVLKAEPDWAALPEATPPAIRALLQRCLRKDVHQRPRDAADISLELDDARAASLPGASTLVVQARAPAPRRWLLFGALACVAVAALTGIAVWNLRPAPATTVPAVERLTIGLRPNTQLVWNNFEMAALSPDGTHLVYAASGGRAASQLYLRAMDSLEATAIAGTEGAGSPFFSPDGQWIGFLAGGRLKKVSVSGGAALTLSNGPDPRGATWGPNDSIVFAPAAGEGLWQVPAVGGEPQKFSTIQQGETSHRWPQFLPDGKTVLYTVQTGGNTDDGQIAVQRLGATEHQILIRGGSYARYVPTGHLVYYRAGTIMAAPFDPERLEVGGTSAPVLEGVMSSAFNSGAGQFSFSNRGSLVYVSGSPQSGNVTLVWVDRQGAGQPLAAPPRNYRAPRLSPDGRRIAVGIGSDVWIYDIPRDTLTRLTFERNNASNAAVWTPDGKRVAFPSDRAGAVDNIFWKAADGSGPEERLTTSDNVQRVGSFSPDGRTMIYTDLNPKTGQDLWVLPMSGAREAQARQGAAETNASPTGRSQQEMEGDWKPRVFLATPFAESSALLSPDGRWVAYVSDESGRLEVYVRPFPGLGGKWQVSTDGGSEAAWSPKGNELFYRTGSQKEKMMVVEIQTQPTFSAGKPRLLFEGSYVAGAIGAQYSVSPDGQRFLMTKVPEQQSALTEFNVVLNWFEELKKKVPVK